MSINQPHLRTFVVSSAEKRSASQVDVVDQSLINQISGDNQTEMVEGFSDLQKAATSVQRSPERRPGRHYENFCGVVTAGRSGNRKATRQAHFDSERNVQRRLDVCFGHEWVLTEFSFLIFIYFFFQPDFITALWRPLNEIPRVFREATSLIWWPKSSTGNWPASVCRTSTRSSPPLFRSCSFCTETRWSWSGNMTISSPVSIMIWTTYAQSRIWEFQLPVGTELQNTLA